MEGNFQFQAVNISSDVEDFFESYNLDDLSNDDELQQYVTEISELKRDFRRVHAQLKTVQGKDFEKNHPTYQTDLSQLNSQFQKANNKLSSLRIAEKNRKDQCEKLRDDPAKSKYVSERKFCIDQASWEMKDCVWDKFSEIESVNKMVSKLESRLEKFLQNCCDIGPYLSEDEATDINVENDQMIASIREIIKFGKSRITEIEYNNETIKQNKLDDEAQERKSAVLKRMQDAEIQEKLKINNILICAENLRFEIKTRYDALKSKCILDFSNLTDHEILDLKKRTDNVQLELREFIEKISKFEKFVMPCGPNANDLRKNVIDMRDTCTYATEKYLENLVKVIIERDISEKKLQNSAGLNIKLQKFVGYTSEMDIFTFRSQFKKLIEPNIQKCLWADHLKKNCLGGAAYNLVSKEESIDEIWKKLFNAYGDTHLMLQNKLSNLKEFSDLEKMKDDEKIAYSLSSLINVMADLKKLADKYNLEGELYYGGGIQKILEIMGKKRERKFIKSIATIEIVDSEGKKSKLGAQGKWEKLVGFLNIELKEREAFTLNEKIKISMGLENKSKKDDKKDGF